MSLFQKSVLEKYLTSFDKNELNLAYEKFLSIYNSKKIEKIKKLKEEEYQDGFLRDLFVKVLGYTLKPDENFNMVREFKNQKDNKKADAAILKKNKAIAVIELKSTKTKDLRKVTEQAFNYRNNQINCRYIITSNFHKLRFFIDYASDFEEFNLFNLKKNDFNRFYILLNKKSILNHFPLKLKEETKFHEEKISNELYKDYSILKSKIFENLVLRNKKIDKLILFKKSQKLLDRLLFIFFAQDIGLLPINTIKKIIDRFFSLQKLDAYKPLYEVYKQYFSYMNEGRNFEDENENISAYNGGLFAEDEILDKLIIDDKILWSECLKISKYNFKSEVDVNILGHIFEHSLNEMEEMNAKIEGKKLEKKKSKRKKDGVFYTPKYITTYIIENTIGKICMEKYKELEILEIEFDNTFRRKDGKLNKKGKELFKKLEDYKNWLLSLKILDPACGSGAFLNEALNFLIKEHQKIDNIIVELTQKPLRIYDTDKSILEQNLFGVDINEESVEIAKLSLWLRTAKKGRKLSSLNNNIKCGNSLIDDKKIAGEKAFIWEKEFKEIMKNGGFD
ncbi:MAG: restriction endonuclease subunit M, partial [Bacteroidetes bacterium 4572_128]